MKKENLFMMSIGHLQRAAVLLLLTCLTVAAKATITGTYNSSTKTLTFTTDFVGTDEIEITLTNDRVRSTTGYDTATRVVIGEGFTHVGHHAFYGCTPLESVTLPSSLKGIAVEAFWEMSNIKSVIIPEKSNLTSIGYRAFDGSGITSISIPSTVTNIDYYAFKDCANLSKITFESGTTTLNLGCQIFNGAGSSASSVEFDCDRPFAYNEGSKPYEHYAVTVVTQFDYPSDYGLTFGFNVTKIVLGPNVTEIPDPGLSASSLKTLDMSQATGLTSIPAEAFSGCSLLSSVSFPPAITNIGDYAFRDCSALTPITIPATVTTIGEYAFSGCSNLETATILGTPTIADDAFPSTTSLVYGTTYEDFINHYTDKESVTELYIPNDNVAGYSGYTESSNLHTLFPNVTKVTFGKNVTTVGSYIFCVGSSGLSVLASVTFESEPSIGIAAFYGNLKLTITGAVKSVSEQAFQRTEIRSITITGSEEIGARAFYECYYLKSVTLTSTVKVIGERAFMYDSKLANITLPASLTTISTHAFFGCYCLDNVVIPKSVTTIDSSAFGGTTAIKNLTIDNNTLTSATYTSDATLADLFGDRIKNLTIGDNVTEISADAFAGCSTLESVYIGSGVTSIDIDAFVNDEALTDVTINSNNLTSISRSSDNNLSHVFTKVKNLTFGENVTKIGEYCFNPNFTNFQLEKVTFSNNLTAIIACAFAGCTKLNNVEIPASVTRFNTEAFSGCKSLKNVTINSARMVSITYYTSTSNLATMFPYAQEINLESNAATAIGAYAFYGLTSLQSVTLPTNIETIGTDAFNGCSNLTLITCPNVVAPTLTADTDPFTGVDKDNCELDVPYSSISNYQNATVWKDFYDIFASDGMKLVDGVEYTNDEDQEWAYPVIRYTRTFPDVIVNKWQCLYVPVDITVNDENLEDFDFAKLYMVSYKDEDGDGEITDSDPLVMLWNKVSAGQTLKHNTPYFIRAKSAGKKNIDIEGDGGYPTLYAATEGTVDCSTTEATYTLTGVYNTTDINGKYTLNGSGTFSYYTESHDLKPNRWYMTITDRSGNATPAKAINIFIDGEDDPTGIAAFSANNKPAPISVYTIDGRKVESIDNLPAGTYIINGKKVFIK